MGHTVGIKRLHSDQAWRQLWHMSAPGVWIFDMKTIIDFLNFHSPFLFIVLSFLMLSKFIYPNTLL
jgi:hypothetical protein